MHGDEIDALLTLQMTEGLGPTLIRRAIDAFGGASRVLGGSARDLAAIDGIGATKSRHIRDAIDRVARNGDVDREKCLIDHHGVSLLAISDDGYPRLLRHIPDPPPLLYLRGDLRDDDAIALAVVGARRCTHYGREQADRLSALAAQTGLTIISGGAYGIDTAAHRAAVRVEGRTIVVLGSGLAKPYPDANVELFDQIAAGRGAVISELPMTAPPAAEHFPRRNRIISGLALGVLVVEAAARSGALITARLAVEEHGREVMALPGRVDAKASEGCHKIIREGWATLVTNLADVLDALGETGELLKVGVTQSADEPAPPLTENLTDTQRKIVDALVEPMALDELAGATGIPVHVIQSDLTILELRGAVKRQSGRFVTARK